MRESFDWKKGIFLVYLLLLVWVILFKLSFSFEGLVGHRSVNLIPFYYGSDVNTRFHLKEVFYNILIFVPFGLFLRMFEVRGRVVILYGFLMSLLFEMLQYLWGIGASDITDLIGNTTGVLAGVIFYFVLEKIFQSREKVNRLLMRLAVVGMVLFFCLFLLLFIVN